MVTGSRPTRRRHDPVPGSTYAPCSPRVFHHQSTSATPPASPSNATAQTRAQRHHRDAHHRLLRRWPGRRRRHRDRPNRRRDLYSGSELVRCYGRLTVLAGLTAIIGPVIGGQLALVTRLARPVPAPRRRRRRHPGRPPPSCSRETLPRRQRVTADLPVPWAPAANTTRRGPHPGRVLVDGVGDQVAGAGFAPATVMSARLFGLAAHAGEVVTV
jgi:hypothetical protein